MNLEPIIENYRRIPLSDREIIGPILQQQDGNEDYLKDNHTYAWHVAIGASLSPGTIGEIGVRFGYSLYSLARGAITTGSTRPSLWGWDSQCYVPGSIAVAQAALGEHATLRDVNTRTLDSLECPAIDLFHVDGDHSFHGCAHDMRLAWATIRSGGTMLVDDFHFISDVRDAVSCFARDHRMSYGVLPTFRGTAVFFKED